jgi:hypothetical protein
MTNSGGDPRLRRLSLPGHLLALLLVFIPLSSTVLALMMPGPDGVGRRIQGAALLIDKMPLPAVGLFLGVVLATYFQQRALSHVHAALSALLGILVLGLAPLFLLDTLQIRNAVEMRRLYDLNTARALLEHLLYGVLLLLLALATWRNLRVNRAPAVRPDLIRVAGPPGRASTNPT